jgi:hypothetical protein
MSRAFLIGLAAIVIAASPVLAAENCDQSLKDTQAAFKTSAIAPKTTQQADAAIKRAEELCKEGKAAEANELLRLARTMIGE